jgi:hypothetical protein
MPAANFPACQLSGRARPDGPSSAATAVAAWPRRRRASTKLHNQLFRRVLSAPILFFLRTPVGDVLNAFARDQVGGRTARTSRGDAA